LPLVTDKDAQVRSAAARLLGDGRFRRAVESLVGLLKDPQPQVRFSAAQALGRIGSKECVASVIQMLRDNNDGDAYLRHAAVMALANCGDVEAVRAAGTDPLPAVRRAVVVALRRLEDPSLRRFLDDVDPEVALEAARAIHDVPVLQVLPDLADRLHSSGRSELFLFRALNACFRLNRPQDSVAVASFAARSDVRPKFRVEALRDLGEWAKPGRRDRVTGLTQNLASRDASAVAPALKSSIAAIFDGPTSVREQAAKTMASLGIKEVGPVLFALVADGKNTGETRVQALRALAALEDPRLEEARDASLTATDASLRTEARRLLARSQPARALPILAKALREEDIRSQQGAYSILGEMTGADADLLLQSELDRLLSGTLRPDVVLDLLQAVASHEAGPIRERLARHESSRRQSDHLASYRETLVGGDAQAGRRIFLSRAEVSCLRCHKVNGEGGEVGPDLTGVGSRQNREYLLESIVDPNRQITKGFETLVLILKNGKTVSGVIKSEDAEQLRLMTPEGQSFSVAKNQIDERQNGKSAMPEDVIKHLSKSDLRDLVEYLASLKETKPR
jgi:quinoprotein glucose dehydrogenase